MPIKFESFNDQNYFLSTWTGNVTDAEAVESYKRFFESSEWVPGMNELADLSQFNFKNISTQGLISISNLGWSVCRKHNLKYFKSACYCPKDIQGGMAYAYKYWADKSPESVKIFKDINEAKSWVLNNE